MLDLQEFANTMDNLTVQHKRPLRVRRVIRDGLIAGALLSVVTIVGIEVWKIYNPPMDCYVASPNGEIQPVDCR
jgi:hypothetical protein